MNKAIAKTIQRKILALCIVIVSFSTMFTLIKAQKMNSQENSLTTKQKSIIYISSLTAKGDLEKLKIQLNAGLNEGLTVNEIKEILVHTYAYCGFPRSIRGLQTFMEVLHERTAKGINDVQGKDISMIKENGNRYERGKKMLSDLTQTPPSDTLSGYSAFAPTMDRFLKEHLFADLFERDILTYEQRELVTISVIAAIGDAEPMLKSHLGISLNVGITPQQLKEFALIIKDTIDENKAKSAQEVVNEILKNR